MLSDYKAIIFDWDGTLVDTCGLVLDAHNHVRKHMGLELWTMDDFMGKPSQSAREYYPQVYGERSDEAQKILYDYVEEHHLAYLAVMPQAQALLEYLKEHNMPMGIVSNKRHGTLHKEIDALEWQHYFSSAIGATYADKDKPSPDPLFMAIKQIGEELNASDILYVGDTETDLLCAQNAACPVAFIQSDKPRPDLIEKYEPDYSYSDINAFLTDIRGGEAHSNLNKAC